MRQLFVFLLILGMLVMSVAGCSARNETIGEKPDLAIDAGKITDENDKPDNDSKDTGPTFEPAISPVVTDIPSGTMPPLDISADKGYIRILKPHSSYENFTIADLESWHDYILDKYDFDADIVFTSINEDAGHVININSIRENSSGGGFVYIESVTQLNLLIESGLIAPVNEVIGKVDVYNSVDEDAVMALSDSEGNVWGFPLSEASWERGATRVYDKDVLDMAGMDVPLNIDDFYDFAMFVSQTDVDGNGEFDTSVGEFSCATMLMDLRDIFRAFGLFNYGQSPIAYNPVKGMYENCVYNENFIEAMAFIKLMYDKGVLADTYPMNDIDSGNFTFLSPGDYSCASSLWASQEHNFGTIAVGRYLIGNNEEMLVEKKTSAICLAMLNDTPDAAGQLNSFFGMLRSNPGSFMDFAYGEEGVSYTETEDEYKIKAVDANGMYILKRLGFHIGLENLGFEGKKTSRNNREADDDSAVFFSAMENAENEARPIDPGVVYSIPFEGFSGQLEMLRNRTYRATRDMFKNIIYGNTSIEDAVEQYKTAMNGLKIPDAIDAMNRKLIN